MTKSADEPDFFSDYVQGDVIELIDGQVVPAFVEECIEISPRSKCVRNKCPGPDGEEAADTAPSGKSPEKRPAPVPLGYLIVSQTCDVVNVGKSKRRITLAPVYSARQSEMQNAERGAMPLKISVGGDVHQLADLSKIFSVNKVDIGEKVKLFSHSYETTDFRQAREFSQILASVYGRFAFPDEVHDALRPLEDAIRKGRTTRKKPKGVKEPKLVSVLKFVDDVRVSTEDWSAKELTLKIWIVVDDAHLEDGERITLDAERILGESSSDNDAPNDDRILLSSSDILPGGIDLATEEVNNPSVERCSEMLVNLESVALDCACCLEFGVHDPGCAVPIIGAKKNLLQSQLWKRLGVRLKDLVAVQNSRGVVRSVQVEVLNRNDFTFANYISSESLQFGHLSNAQDISDSGQVVI